MPVYSIAAAKTYVETKIKKNPANQNKAYFSFYLSAIEHKYFIVLCIMLNVVWWSVFFNSDYLSYLIGKKLRPVWRHNKKS